MAGQACDTLTADFRYMHFETTDHTLRVTRLAELNSATAAAFRDQIRGTLAAGHQRVDVDFSETRFVDSSGLGALIAVHKTLCGQGGSLRILNPSPHVRQILELTRMHRIFEIVVESPGS